MRNQVLVPLRWQRTDVLKFRGSGVKRTCTRCGCLMQSERNYAGSTKVSKTAASISTVDKASHYKNLASVLWKSFDIQSKLGQVTLPVRRSSLPNLDVSKKLVTRIQNLKQMKYFQPAQLMQWFTIVKRNSIDANAKVPDEEIKLPPTQEAEIPKANSTTVVNKKDEVVADNLENHGDNFEEVMTDWMKDQSSDVARAEVVSKNVELPVVQKPTPSTDKQPSKDSIYARGKFLLRKVSNTTSTATLHKRLEEFCQHLLKYPESKDILIKENSISILLRLRENALDINVREQARQALVLLGYHDPPSGRGIRVLSIDGGGTRGVVVVEMLRHLEERTGQRIHEMFDYICGTSTGAILATFLGNMHFPLDECEKIYRRTSVEIFKSEPWWGTGRLFWSHAYYDSHNWAQLLQGVYAGKSMIDSAKITKNPKVSAISAIMNQPRIKAFLFRNYNYPFRVISQYDGSCSNQVWQAVQASGAAPGYFEEVTLDGIIHQDGGLLINNPAALALHEAKLLWPKEKIQCVISLGCGQYVPSQKKAPTSTNIKTKIIKIIDSATETESVHTVLNDLLPPKTYFRFNPHLSEPIGLDESRSEKLELLKQDTAMYLRRNEYKLDHAVSALNQSRSYLQKASDWLALKKDTYT